MSIDESFKTILRRRIETKLRRRDPAFHEALRAESDRAQRVGAYGGDRFTLALEQLAARETWERADLLWKLTKQRIDEMDLRVDEDVADNLRALVRPLWEAEIRSAKGRVRRMLPNDAKLTGTLHDVLQPGLDQITTEIEALRVQHERTRPAPIADLLAPPRYQAAREHWQASEAAMGEDPPDTRAAAAEAIHTVESVACLITGMSTLGKAINSLRNEGRISSGSASTLSKLWGFANDTVRHGSPDGPEISAGEARYMKELATAALRLLLTLDTAT